MTLEDFFTPSEIKDGLTSLSRIEELISVMQKEKDCVVNTSDVIGKWTVVANAIASTESKDCLDLFVKQGGLQDIDKWLKDAGDLGGNAKDSCVEESITAFLLALEKLCVDKEVVVPPGIHVTLNKLFGHSSLKVQNRSREVFNKLKLSSDRDTNSDNFVSTELVNDGNQGSSDPEASVQVKKQTVDNSAEKMPSEILNGIGPEKLQNEMGVEGESLDLPPSSLSQEKMNHHDDMDIKKDNLDEISAVETGKDDVVIMVDKRHSCHESATVSEASAAIHADDQGGVPSSIGETMKEENRDVLSSMEKADEIMKSASPGSTERLTMETASPESKSSSANEDKEDISTEQENQTEKSICGFDLNEEVDLNVEVGSDDADCKGDKMVLSEGQQERHVSLDFDLNMTEGGETEDSFAVLNPGRLEKLELDLNSAGEEKDDDVVFLGSRMSRQTLDHHNSHRYASSSAAQLNHFQMNFSLNGQSLSGPKSDPFISIMGTKVAVQKEEVPHVAAVNGSAVPSMNSHGGSIPFMMVEPRSDRITSGPVPFLHPSSYSNSMPFMMNSSAGPSRPQTELNLGCADNGGFNRAPPGFSRQFLPPASEEQHPGTFLQPLSGLVGSKRKNPDAGGLVLYP